MAIKDNTSNRWLRAMTGSCLHRDHIKAAVPRSQGCEECLAAGDNWVELRSCLTCGHVGCCDSSKNKHAARHFAATGHPLIKSCEPREGWAWCYLDQTFLALDDRVEEPER